MNSLFPTPIKGFSVCVITQTVGDLYMGQWFYKKQNSSKGYQAEYASDSWFKGKEFDASAVPHAQIYPSNLQEFEVIDTERAKSMTVESILKEYGIENKGLEFSLLRKIN